MPHPKSPVPDHIPSSTRESHFNWLRLHIGPFLGSRDDSHLEVLQNFSLILGETAWDCLQLTVASEWRFTWAVDAVQGLGLSHLGTPLGHCTVLKEWWMHRWPTAATASVPLACALGHVSPGPMLCCQIPPNILASSLAIHFTSTTSYRCRSETQQADGGSCWWGEKKP